MKVAVCSSGTGLDSIADPRFGRCACFVIVDTETMEASAEPNPGAMMAQGAGIQAAQMVSAKGVEAIIAGQVGPNAFQGLTAAGVKLFLGFGGTIRQIVEQLKAGGLEEVGSPTVDRRFGTDSSQSQALAPGGGRGMGFGGGRGRGGGTGRGRGRMSR